MVVRTYFDKNNTIIRNNTTNTGRSPIAELFYGGNVYDLEYSRFIFHFDETRLRSLYTGGTFPDLNKMKHTLRMTNTSCFDLGLLNGETCDGKERACSFDLILFPLDEHFDEGNGYDYNSCTYLAGDASISNTPSNWVYARTGVSWPSGSGAYSGNTSAVTIGSQHFERGNENIEIDITNYVNAIISGETNYGLALAYSYALENTPTQELQYVGFFTRHTQTFYEPFIETTYTEVIRDDRYRFYMNKNNKLYLYVNAGGLPTNLDSNPTVTIYDNNDVVFSTYTPTDVTHVTTGVYSIDINVPINANYGNCTMFRDVWSSLSINGVNLSDVELEFVINRNGYYNIGTNEEIPKVYGFNITGIKRDEKIVRGDIRKVIVSARIPFTINQRDILDTLRYRLYIKEGPAEYTVIDYQPVEMAFDQNYFLLDTSTLLPNTYWLDIELSTNREVRTIKDIVNFDIINQVELRNNY